MMKLAYPTYPQGELSMFLEIVPVQAAFLHGLSGGLPPLKIEQPEPEDWEVRVGPRMFTHLCVHVGGFSMHLSDPPN